MRYFTYMLKRLLPTITFWIVLIILVAFILGYVGVDVVIMALSFWIVENLNRVQELLGNTNIIHDNLLIEYGRDNVWIFRMDNHVAYIDRNTIQGMRNYLSKTLNFRLEDKDG